MKTLQEMRQDHETAVRANRKLPVTEWAGGSEKADVILEVVEGKHHTPATAQDKAKGVPFGRGKTLVPGMRFRPTKASLEKRRDGRGGLDVGLEHSKFKEVEGAYVPRTERKPMSTGADIGLRSLKTLKGKALKAALDAGLRVEDFDEVEPTGQFGRYTLEQVQAVVDAKANTFQGMGIPFGRKGGSQD